MPREHGELPDSTKYSFGDHNTLHNSSVANQVIVISRSLRPLYLSALLLLTFVVMAFSASGVAPADRVYRNGIIFMGDARNGTAEALAIRDGRIVYVGSDLGLTPFLGSATTSVDKKG